MTGCIALNLETHVACRIPDWQANLLLAQPELDRAGAENMATFVGSSSKALGLVSFQALPAGKVQGLLVLHLP